MRRLARTRPSPALVIALLALSVALSGVAWAVTKVGAGDIKKNAVRSKHIKNGQVRPGDLAKVRVHTLELIDGWQEHGAPSGVPRAVKDGFGFVHLEGAIEGGDATTSVPFQLPSGFRPAHLVDHPVDSGPGTYNYLWIEPDGTTEVRGNLITGAAITSLEGVTFRAR